MNLLCQDMKVHISTRYSIWGGSPIVMLNHHGILFFSQILNLFLCDISEHNFLLQINKSTTFQLLIIHNVEQKIERRRTVRGWLIVIRKITNQIKIAWLQLIFNNKLLYPISVSNCPGTERGVFCI